MLLLSLQKYNVKLDGWIITFYSFALENMKFKIVLRKQVAEFVTNFVEAFLEFLSSERTADVMNLMR